MLMTVAALVVLFSVVMGTVNTIINNSEEE
jgi:hypothetical protein